MTLSKTPMNRTLELLVDILKFMRDNEELDSKYLTTVHRMIRGVQTIYNSANGCKKLAIRYGLIREMKYLGENRQKQYRITPAGKQFIIDAEEKGVYSAFRTISQLDNTAQSPVEETPTPN